jgi:hypothetical protein
VNPPGIEAPPGLTVGPQGSVAYGLSAALVGEITGKPVRSLPLKNVKLV